MIDKIFKSCHIFKNGGNHVIYLIIEGLKLFKIEALGEVTNLIGENADLNFVN